MIKIGNDISRFSAYSFKPRTKHELQSIISERIDKEGNECNLNDIDTSLITDMSELFADSKFNGDISKWDLSNVTNMGWMFAQSVFNGDISNWDISKVTDMSHMFIGAHFKQDISNWNIRPDCSTKYIFLDCPIRKAYKPKLPK